MSLGGGAFTLQAGTGIGLSHTAGTTTISSTLTNFYQLFRDDNTNKTQRDAANFVSSVRVALTLTDDAANNETEVSADLVLNSVSDGYLSTRAAASVMGRSAATGGNVADIVSASDGQVLRRAGATLGWGTVATASIADDAVTYPKLQNAAANNVLLGNNNGAGTDYEELNAAAVQTMLGYIDALALANQQIAYGSDANTITSEAAFLYDAANDKMTINNTTPGIGAGNAIINLANVGTDVNGEFLYMRGAMSGNMLAGMANSNTSATANTIWQISQAGNSAGDAYNQYNITGAGGVSASIGLDNSDNNYLKISPNATAPGQNANNGIIITHDAVADVGINKDAPAYPLDVQGVTRATEFIGYSVDEPTVGTLGNGLGTGATIDDVTGTNNWFSITFSTGSTGLTAGGNFFVVTFSDAFPGFAIPVIGQVDDDAANELNKFTYGAITGGSFTLKARTGQTLTPSTQYTLNFAVGGF